MMEEGQHFCGTAQTSSSLDLALGYSPSFPCNWNSTNAAVDGVLDQLDDSTNFRILSSNLQSLISPVLDYRFSDVLFYVSGHVVPLHQCILVARSPFFRSLFTKDMSFLASLSPANEVAETTCLKLRIDLSRIFDTFPDVGKVSYEAFMNTMEFIYSGTQTDYAVSCMDEECLHEACRPVVDFAIDMLGLASVLDLTVLKDFWQIRLHHILGKAGGDEALLVLKAAKLHGAESLISRSLQLIAVSDICKVDIEKQLPIELAAEVVALRCSMGLLQLENLKLNDERACKRIRKALDSDDVELVSLLLKEGCLSLDEAQALHYAVSYCDPHTVKDIMDLGLVDVNLKNDRGFTPLHVASMRCDPSILVTLLSKGAKSHEMTPDGRTAFQICSRVVRKRINFDKNTMIEERDCLCVRMLCEAETNGLFDDATKIFQPTDDENELFMRLIYLENRIAVARLLFPQEAKLVTDICDLKSTSEFVGFGFSEFSSMFRGESKLDFEQISSSHFSISEASMAAASMPAPVMNEALLKRIDALQKSVILGRKMFPYTFTVLNTFTDDGDPSELSTIQSGTSKEQRQKKRRYRELKQALEVAFQKDWATMERCKFSHKRMPSSST